MFSNLITKAYAATTIGGGTPMDGKTLVTNIVDNIVNPIIALMVAVAVIVFLWGAFQFIRNAESPEERQKRGMTMLWGVIGLFIMASAYGILNLIIGTINQ